jgi:hypothetical protein
MRLYYPEAKGQIDFVGYNQAIRLFRRALSSYISDSPNDSEYRMYCNLPWHHAPKSLKGDKPLFIYTMYESTRLPSAWVTFLNRHADIIAVPTYFCKNVFLSCGVKKPIGILSLGLDPDEIQPSLKTNTGGEYAFLWQGVAYDPKGRKGVDVAVQAFRELKNEGLIDNAKLILKYRCSDGLPMNGIEDAQGIVYLQSELKRCEMHELYKKIDCCINPTRGEGFGLIPLEQMAIGKPVIMTGFSLPYIEHDCCLPVDYRLKQSPIFWNHKFLSVSKNGAVWNSGGLSKGIRIMPKLLQQLPDGGKVQSFPPLPINRGEALKGKINNAVMNFQKAIRFYHNPRARSFRLYQENTGKDATVVIQDLKQKMLWCYNNREAAEKMGTRAREYALREWTLERMRSDFHNNILPLLEGGLHGRSN